MSGRARSNRAVTDRWSPCCKNAACFMSSTLMQCLAEVSTNSACRCAAPGTVLRTAHYCTVWLKCPQTTARHTGASAHPCCCQQILAAAGRLHKQPASAATGRAITKGTRQQPDTLAAPTFLSITRHSSSDTNAFWLPKESARLLNDALRPTLCPEVLGCCSDKGSLSAEMVSECVSIRLGIFDMHAVLCAVPTLIRHGSQAPTSVAAAAVWLWSPGS